MSLFEKQKFWQNEYGNFKANGGRGKIIFKVNAANYSGLFGNGKDYLKQLATELKDARGLDDHVEDVMRTLIEENAFGKDIHNFEVKDGMELNVGRLFRAGGNKYRLFRNVSKEIERVVMSNVRDAKDMSLILWIFKVIQHGEWDFKRQVRGQFNGLFHYKRIENGKSGLYVLDGWNYDGSNILLYDDPGNINYGATGRALEIAWTKKKWFHLKSLLQAGGIVQRISDEYEEAFGKKRSFIFERGYDFLFALNYCPTDIPGLDAQMTNRLNREMDQVNEKIREAVKNNRNAFGDDPRDSYAIKWGYEKFGSH